MAGEERMCSGVGRLIRCRRLEENRQPFFASSDGGRPEQSIAWLLCRMSVSYPRIFSSRRMVGKVLGAMEISSTWRGMESSSLLACKSLRSARFRKVSNRPKYSSDQSRFRHDESGGSKGAKQAKQAKQVLAYAKSLQILGTELCSPPSKYV